MQKSDMLSVLGIFGVMVGNKKGMCTIYGTYSILGNKTWKMISGS